MEKQGAERPSVDVVLPFAGSDDELAETARGLARIRLGPADTVTLVDNRPSASPREIAGVRIVAAPERRSSYFARNRGASEGDGEWLLFIDADVAAPPEILDRYFAVAPDSETGILAGAIADVETGPTTAISSYLARSSSMSQSNTLRGRWAYAQTANCAVRREAFEDVGGFNDSLRSGGDADLCFRLRAAGWELEGREEAGVEHRTRTTLRELVRQRARHGSGAAWLNRAYPGSFPRARLLGLLKWTLTQAGRAGLCLARGDRAGAADTAIALVHAWALQLGRLLPNKVGDAV